MEIEIDELKKLETRPEVLAPNGPFEATNKPVEGPYYASAHEVIPEVEEPSALDEKVDTQYSQPFSIHRRNFMRLFGLGTAAAAGACVRRPVEKAIPFVHQPEDQIPGKATYYNTTCGGCSAGCGVSVKTREGRPVKLEGIEGHPVNKGGLCAMGQAMIQGLYHPERLVSPWIRVGDDLDPASWDDTFQGLGKLVEGKRVGILTAGSTGHRHGFFREVLKKLGSSDQHLYTWDSNSLGGSIAKAHELAFGVRAIPRYSFQSTETIVGISTDFLEGGVSKLHSSKEFSRFREYRNHRRGHFTQFETNLTSTGSSADTRHVIPPKSEGLVALLIVRSLLENSKAKGSKKDKQHISNVLKLQERQLDDAYSSVGIEKDVFDKLATKLLSKPSVLLAGGSSSYDENATQLQLTAVMANILIGAHDRSLLLSEGWVNPTSSGDH